MRYKTIRFKRTIRKAELRMKSSDRQKAMKTVVEHFLCIFADLRQKMETLFWVLNFF